MIRKPRLIVPALLVSLSVLSFVGCAEDNESTATSNIKSTSQGGTPPPKNQAEYGKQQQQTQSGQNKAAGYPGAK
jgi:uncharacterized BrkB/YihY/UPF0761 family membrane protein